ncbi:hypothetical protein BGZ65_008850, partial [Modicella reniformis]
MYQLVPSEEDDRDEDRTVSGSHRGQGENGMKKKKKTRPSLKDRFTNMLLGPGKPEPPCCPTPIKEGPNGPTINGFTLPRKKEKYCIDLIFMKRLWRFFKLLVLKPSRVGWLYLIMTVFCCANEGVVYFVGTIPSQYYKVLGDKDSPSFWRLLFTSLGTVFLAGL